MKELWRNKRPIIIASVVMIICIVVALGYSRNTTIQSSGAVDSSTQVSPQDQAKSATLKAELLSEKDSDNDSLQDWQEVLWNTDPNNPDTDGDGTPDGVEVKEGRDPRVPGPNDLLSVTQNTAASSTVSTSATNQPLTETDLVAQTIFSKYLALSNQDGTLDSQTMNTMVQNLVQSTPFQPQYTTYSLADLKIEQTDSASGPQEIRAYGNSLEEIAKKYSPKKTQNELDIVYKSMFNNNQDEISNLDPIINSYKNILKGELALPVPRNAATLHMSFVNAISEVLYNIEGMRKLFTDPVLSLSGVTNYENSGTDLGNAMQKLGDYFIQQGVIFAPEEAGYPLTLRQ